MLHRAGIRASAAPIIPPESCYAPWVSRPLVRSSLPESVSGSDEPCSTSVRRMCSRMASRASLASPMRPAERWWYGGRACPAGCHGEESKARTSRPALGKESWNAWMIFSHCNSLASCSPRSRCSSRSIVALSFRAHALFLQDFLSHRSQWRSGETWWPVPPRSVAMRSVVTARGTVPSLSRRVAPIFLSNAMSRAAPMKDHSRACRHDALKTPQWERGACNSTRTRSDGIHAQQSAGCRAKPPGPTHASHSIMPEDTLRRQDQGASCDCGPHTVRSSISCNTAALTRHGLRSKGRGYEPRSSLVCFAAARLVRIEPVGELQHEVYRGSMVHVEKMVTMEQSLACSTESTAKNREEDRFSE